MTDTVHGTDLDPETCDELMTLHIRKEWRDYEGPLYSTKWYDYRFMHPVQATFLYAHEYAIAYRRFYRSTIDRKAAEHIKIIKDPDIFKIDKKILSGLWRGRQHADAMCIPYDQYIDLAMTARLSYWNQRHLPPCFQLYSELVVQTVEREWADRQAGILFFGKHGEFRMPRYIGTPTQNDHHEWLLEQVVLRGSNLNVLGDLMRSELLPAEKITLRFGNDVAERALQAA